MGQECEKVVGAMRCIIETKNFSVKMVKDKARGTKVL